MMYLLNICAYKTGCITNALQDLSSRNEETEGAYERRGREGLLEEILRIQMVLCSEVSI